MEGFVSLIKYTCKFGTIGVVIATFLAILWLFVDKYLNNEEI